MTATAVLLIAIVVILVPVAVARPWIGFLAYTWVSFMLPHRLVGGMVSEYPFAKILALATLAGLLFTSERHPLPRRRELVILAGFWLVCVGSTLFTAQQPERAWATLAEFSKIVLMTFVALVLFQDRWKLRCWLAVIALSIGSLALAGGVRALASGFKGLLFGPPGSIIGDNNALGFALAMILPLLAFLQIEAGRPWMRRLLLVTFFFTLVAVVATFSRGSFAVLCVVAPLVLYLLPRRGLIVATCAAGLIVTVLAPGHWWERMETISPTAHRDTPSGVQRMKSWYVAWRLGVDHPLLGAGFRPFSPNVYERYIPGYVDYHDAHNHFLQVLAEHGFIGLALFAALLASVMIRTWRLAGAAVDDPHRGWVKPAAQMLLVSLIAYVAGGFFINLPYFELLYQLVAVAVLVDVIERLPLERFPLALGVPSPAGTGSG